MYRIKHAYKRRGFSRGLGFYNVCVFSVCAVDGRLMRVRVCIVQLRNYWLKLPRRSRSSGTHRQR